jgi:hypothetical protein
MPVQYHMQLGLETPYIRVFLCEVLKIRAQSVVSVFIFQLIKCILVPGVNNVIC